MQNWIFRVSWNSCVIRVTRSKHIYAICISGKLCRVLNGEHRKKIISTFINSYSCAILILTSRRKLLTYSEDNPIQNRNVIKKIKFFLFHTRHLCHIDPFSLLRFIQNLFASTNARAHLIFVNCTFLQFQFVALCWIYGAKIETNLDRVLKANDAVVCANQANAILLKVHWKWMAPGEGRRQMPP